MQRSDMFGRVTTWALALGLAACGGRDAAWETTPAANSGEPAGSGAEAAPDALAQGDAAWEGRDDEASVRTAIAAWEKHAAANPSDYAVWAKVARAYYFLADGHVRFHSDEKRDSDLLTTFESSVTSAERGLMAMSEPFAKKMQDGEKIEEAVSVLDKSAVPLLYWRSASLGKWASEKGFATLLSYKEEIRTIMQHCLEKDPEFNYYAPDRYFGVFYARAPSFAGGNLEKSRKHFDASVAKQPSYFATRVLMAADLAVKAQDKKLFEDQLKLVLETDANTLPEVAPENRVEQKKAKELLAQKEDLFE